jgi:hypothetical protein
MAETARKKVERAEKTGQRKGDDKAPAKKKKSRKEWRGRTQVGLCVKDAAR